MHAMTHQGRSRSLPQDRHFTPSSRPLLVYPTALRRTLDFERWLFGHFPAVPHTPRTRKRLGHRRRPLPTVHSRITYAHRSKQMERSSWFLDEFPGPQAWRSDLPFIIPSSNLGNCTRGWDSVLPRFRMHHSARDGLDDEFVLFHQHPTEWCARGEIRGTIAEN